MKRVYVSVSNDLGYTHNFPNATFSITPAGSVEV